ncbi:MAG: site-specific integrase, partial [bacterium]|nr:site-specific integrase [bacterium]
MQALLDKYIRYLEIERGLSPFTVRNYSTDVLHFLRFLELEGIESLEKIDHSVIRNYLGQLLDGGTVRASISRKMSALRSFFRYLNREAIIRNEPLNKVSSPKTEKRLPSFLTSEEILSLLSAPD